MKLLPVYLGKTINFKDHLNAFIYFFNKLNITEINKQLNEKPLFEIIRIIKISFKNKFIIFIVGPSKYDLILIILSKIFGIKVFIYIHEPKPLKYINTKNFPKRILIYVYQ